jgi:hypothetical protein
LTIDRQPTPANPTPKRQNGKIDMAKQENEPAFFLKTAIENLDMFTQFPATFWVGYKDLAIYRDDMNAVREIAKSLRLSAKRFAARKVTDCPSTNRTGDRRDGE